MARQTTGMVEQLILNVFDILSGDRGCDEEQSEMEEALEAEEG